jgi:hypothetical protein
MLCQKLAARFARTQVQAQAQTQACRFKRELTNFVANTKGSWLSPLFKEGFVVRQTPAMCSSNNVDHCGCWIHQEAAPDCCCQHQQTKMHLCHLSFPAALPFLLLLFPEFPEPFVLREEGLCDPFTTFVVEK